MCRPVGDSVLNFIPCAQVRPGSANESRLETTLIVLAQDWKEVHLP